MIEFPTIDGKDSWKDDLDLGSLPEVEECLKHLRRSLNRLHKDQHKTFTVGLTIGIEAYIEVLKKGKVC